MQLQVHFLYVKAVDKGKSENLERYWKARRKRVESDDNRTVMTSSNIADVF